MLGLTAKGLKRLDEVDGLVLLGSGAQGLGRILLGIYMKNSCLETMGRNSHLHCDGFGCGSFRLEFQKLLAILGVAIVLLISLACPVLSQSEVVKESVADTPMLDDETFVAPVTLDGNTLFLVRGFSAFPAVERAEMIQQRLIAIAESSDKLSFVTNVSPNEFGLSIESDNRLVTVVTNADAEFEQVELDVLAGLQAEAIEDALKQYQESRSDTARVGSALAAVAWSAVFFVVSYLFFKNRRRLVMFFARRIEKRFATVEEATQSFVRGKAIAAIFGYVLNVLMWAGYLVLFYYYLSVVLLAFAETRPFAEILLRFVSDPLINVAVGFVGYLPNLITLVIIVIMTRFGLSGIKLFFDNVEKGVFQLGDFEPHWISPTHFLVKILVILIAVVFAYPYIPGSDSRAFQGLTILAGVMLSLGSNTVISNMMAGLFVIYRRSTNLGDRVQVGDRIGDVVEIKLMETLIKSIKNEMISIPNAQLLNSEVVNYSRTIDGRGLLVHTTVGIGYEEPPKKVEAMLIEAARRTKDLKNSPKPFVLWAQLADYAINYEINAYTSRGASLPKIKSDLHENITEVFNENGTQIMTPSYIADPEIPKIPDQPWDGVLAHEINNKDMPKNLKRDTE